MGATQSTRKITLVDDDKAGVIKLSESLAQRLRGQIEGQQQQQAQRATSAEVIQEPLHPSTPPQAPFLPIPPQPPLLEKPLPVVPEHPLILDNVPLLEPPTVAEAFIPEPRVALEPSAPETSPPPLAGPSTAVGDALKPVAPAVQSSSTELPSAPDIGVAISAGPSPTLAQPGGSIPPWSIYAEEAHLMVMRLREEKDQEVKKLNLEWHNKMESREEEFVKMAHLSEEQVASALKEVESLFMKASCNPVCQNHQDDVMKCYQDHPHQSLRCAREVEHFTQCVDLSRLQTIMKQEAH